MKIYKAAWGGIEERDVPDIIFDGDLTKPARYRDRKQNLHAPWEQWFYTWDAAKLYITKASKKEVDELTAALALAVAKDTKAKGLKKP